MNNILIAFAPLLFIIFAPEAYTQTLEKTISVSPSPMKLSFVDDKLFASSFQYPHVTVVNFDNGKTTEFVTTSTTGVMDIETIEEKNKLYATMYGSNDLDVYSLDMKFLKKIRLPQSQIAFEAPPSDEVATDLSFETGGWALTHNPEFNLLYVSDYHSDVIYVIDVNTDRIVDQISVPAHPYEMAIDQNSNIVVVTSTAGNSISFIKPSLSEGIPYDHVLIKTINVQGAPWGVEIDSKKHLAYVTNRGASTITTFFTAGEPRQLESIPIDYPGQALALDSENGILYVSYQYKNELATVDLKTGQKKYSTSTESYPWDLHFDKESKKLYAALKDADKIAIFDTLISKSYEKTNYFVKSSSELSVVPKNFWTMSWDNIDQLVHTVDDEIAIVEFEIDKMCPESPNVLCFEATVTSVDNSDIFSIDDILQISIFEDKQTILRTSPNGIDQAFELNIENFLQT